MDYVIETMGNLIHQTAFFNLTWGNYVMILVACFFIYLAIGRGYEPLLLLPISFGMLLVNLYPDIMLTVEEFPTVSEAFYIIFICWMSGRFCRHSFSWAWGR